MEPEILGIAIAVIDRQRRKILCGNAVYDSVAVFFLHKNPVNTEDKMRAEFARNSVEIMIRTLVTVQLAWLIAVRAVKLTHPCAFYRFDCVCQHHRAYFSGFLLNHALFKPEFALWHLV